MLISRNNDRPASWSANLSCSVYKPQVKKMKKNKKYDK